MLQPFSDYYDRLEDLHATIKDLIKDLSVEALNWQPGPEMNSLAVLVTHLSGSEVFWIGEMAGGVQSDRVRSEEFEVRDLTAEHLISKLEEALAVSQRVLDTLALDDLEVMRTSAVFHDRSFSVAWSLAHALDHTAVHVGHIEITRQLWDMRES